MPQFHTGLKVYAEARQKARALGITETGLKLEPLIHAIQDREGVTACFRRQNSCTQSGCCWQAACGAEMV